MTRNSIKADFDQKRVVDLIYRIADDIIRPNFRNPANKARSKTTPQDLQTNADVESEQAFKAVLDDILPGSLFVGEEEIDEAPSRINRLKESDTPVWVVDPIDGTANFYHGKPVYGLMLSLVFNRQPIHGWIYDIPGDRLLTAEVGKGASLNGEDLMIPDSPAGKTKPIQDCKGFAFRTRKIKDMEARDGRLDLDSLRCAAHEYIGVATGTRDFSIYKKVKPWDHLAGSLILNEAGGISKHWDSSVYDPMRQDGGIINARHENIYDAVRAALD